MIFTLKTTTQHGFRLPKIMREKTNIEVGDFIIYKILKINNVEPKIPLPHQVGRASVWGTSVMVVLNKTFRELSGIKPNDMITLDILAVVRAGKNNRRKVVWCEKYWRE